MCECEREREREREREQNCVIEPAILHMSKKRAKNIRTQGSEHLRPKLSHLLGYNRRSRRLHYNLVERCVLKKLYKTYLAWLEKLIPLLIAVREGNAQ